VNGVGPMADLALLTDGRSRSISPENPTGEPNAGGRSTIGTGAQYAVDLGQGWKISPSVKIDPGETYTMADIEGSGAVKQLWLTPSGNWRFSILRVYWDGQEHPSIECPIGDFFGMGWGRYVPLASLAVCVNPGSAFNCYWEMPFRKRARFTLTNIADEAMVLYYQLNYELCDVSNDAGYLHARFSRVNPLPYKDVYTVLEGVKGAGHYVGTYIAWGVNNDGWWGEGEIKFFIDGDAWPTICGTGTEDYFCGSYNFENQETHQYEEFTTPYAGLHQVIRPDGVYRSQQRFGMYRWHITDPIRFREDLRVTLQALGWRRGHTAYLPLQDDIASVAYWYQTLPSQRLASLPDRDCLEVI
jgi:D-arabinan exo alpha-(1,3)/(1,5)-arabinofuranosidase (non-reducing end)